LLSAAKPLHPRLGLPNANRYLTKALVLDKVLNKKSEMHFRLLLLLAPNIFAKNLFEHKFVEVTYGLKMFRNCLFFQYNGNKIKNSLFCRFAWQFRQASSENST